MKKLSFILLTAVLLVHLSSCHAGQPIAKQVPENNHTYDVDYLFEHDGCKVYRFYDIGNYVYFTNCGGDATAISNDSTETRVQTIGKKLQIGRP